MEHPTTITDEHLNKYFAISTEALEMAKKAPVKDDRAAIILDMASRYIQDAHHFSDQGNKLRAFAALNYAHGWLDSGAHLKLFEVHDSRLFTVDES